MIIVASRGMVAVVYFYEEGKRYEVQLRVS